MSLKSTAMNITAPVIPAHWQIRAVHRFLKIKNTLFKGPYAVSYTHLRAHET